jgi:hypothetical protein
MNWKEIEISECSTFFMHKGQKLFNTSFKKVLNFHSEGLAPVFDETGWYHIDLNGDAIYDKRYDRTFGYYFGKSAVILNGIWYHIDTSGNRCYKEEYAWVGNFQENICTVRNFENQYFHINKNGNNIYQDKFKYAGDFKDGFAVVKLEGGMCKHIDKTGKDLNGKLYFNLGVFHKSYATAKDEKGWFHINKKGDQLYHERYLSVEPFYNGFSLAETFDNKHIVIDEDGHVIVNI